MCRLVKMTKSSQNGLSAWQCWSDLACISDSVPTLRPIHDNLLVYQASAFSVDFLEA